MRGADIIIEEAIALLRDLAFASDAPAYAEGQRVAVTVDSRWDEERPAFRVLITCYAFGHRAVDWTGRPIVIERTDGDGRMWINFLDRRGQVAFLLPRGQYRLSTPKRYGRSDEPIETVHAEPVLTVRGTLDPTTPEVGFEHRFSSVDGAVAATVRRRHPSGVVEVVFRTQEARLRGATVRFNLINLRSGEVRITDEVVLRRAPGGWEGRWERDINFQDACGLVFEVLPGPVADD